MMSWPVSRLPCVVMRPPNDKKRDTTAAQHKGGTECSGTNSQRVKKDKRSEHENAPEWAEQVGCEVLGMTVSEPTHCGQSPNLRLNDVHPTFPVPALPVHGRGLDPVELRRPTLVS